MLNLMDADSFLEILKYMSWSDIKKTCKLNPEFAKHCKNYKTVICKSQLERIYNRKIKISNKTNSCDLFFNELHKIKKSMYHDIPDKIEFLTTVYKIFGESVKLNDIYPSLLTFAFVYLKNKSIVEYLVKKFDDCKFHSFLDISSKRYFNQLREFLPPVDIRVQYIKTFPFYFAALNCDLEMMKILYDNNCTVFKSNSQAFKLFLKSFDTKHKCQSHEIDLTKDKLHDYQYHLSMKNQVVRNEKRSKSKRFHPYTK